MEWIRQHGILLVFLALYTGLMVRHAWVGQRRSRAALDYFIGGRSIGSFAIAVSFFATYSSTNTFLGFSGKSYSWGVGWLLLVPFGVGLSLTAWLVVAPRLRRFTESLDSITIPDFIGFRYSSTLARIVAAVIVSFASLIYMVAIFKGIGNLFETLLRVPYAAAIMLVFLLVMAYTLVGGFHAVVRTDVIQGALMIVAAIVLFAGIVSAAGGVRSIVGEEAGLGPLLSLESAPPLGILLGVLFATTLKFLVEPRQLSRFYALDSPSAVRRGALISSGLFFVTFACLAPIGLYAHRLLPEPLGDSDRVVPTLLAGGEIFGPWATALLFVAIIAAAMSSLDSVLLVVATTVHRDIISLASRRWNGRGAVLGTRWLVFAFALATALSALRPPADIVALTSFSGAVYGACFLPAVLLGLWWPRGSAAAVLGSFAAGLAVLVLWPFVAWSAWLHAVFPAIVSSFAAFVGIARLSSTPTTAEVEALFASETTG